MLWNFGSPAVLSTATAAQKLEFAQKLNQVVERLLTTGRWRNTLRRCFVPIYDGQVTMPRHLQSILGLKVIAPDTDAECAYRPSLIYSRFHEFSQNGLNDCCGGVYQTGDLAQTWRDPTPGFTLRCKSTAAEGDISLIGGLNETWDEYSTSVTLAITNGTTNQARVYMRMPRIHLPSTTSPRTVFTDLYSVDTTSGEETQIAAYAPGEFVPAYQRYSIKGVCTDATLALIQGKLAYVEAVADTDIIFPGVFGALKQGLRALNYETTDDENRAAGCWASAFKILNDDVEQMQGEAEIPAERYQSGFGCDGIPCMF